MPAKPNAKSPHDTPAAVLREDGIEYGFIGRLQGLKYEYRPDITNRATLETNVREKFEALNRVRLTESEFILLLDEIVTSDVFAASKTLRGINSFIPGGSGGSLPQRGKVYQPSATLWVWNIHKSRVLKERCISSHRLPAPESCGVPSERINGVDSIPRVAPWAGMRGSVGTGSPDY